MKKRNHKKAPMRRDVGLVQVPIRDQHGRRLGVLQFHPGRGITKRCRRCAGMVKKIVEPLTGVSIGPDGTPAAGATTKEISALDQAERQIFEVFDYVFDGNVSSAFFSETRPFAAVGGEFYCTRVLAVIDFYLSTHSPA